MKACAVVPSHDHAAVIGQVVAGLRAQGLAVFVVDDGSGPAAAAAIAGLHDPAGGVVVHRLAVNQGKGGAVLEGFRLARAAGFTHAVQVDADGQHDQAVLPALLALAAAHPEALITGEPVYDRSMPPGRKIGRWLTHVWVWIETLSLRIKDSMCGFRVYPLAAVEALLAEETVGRRMDFDTEIMVRLFWRGTPVLGLPVRVTYPPGNTSNFDLLRDNWRITAMHTRLVLTLLARLPRVLANRPPRTAGPAGPQGDDAQARHWAGLAERGALWGLYISAFAYRLLGRAGCMAMLTPVVAWFFLAGTEQRRASRLFLARALGRPPGLGEQFRHFMSFAGRALDAFAAWTGGVAGDRLRLADPETLHAALADPRGALLVVSHHGNVELARALLDQALRARMTVLVHTRHAANYNRVLRRFRPDAASNLVEVGELGPDTAIALRERVERGEWVVIAGDRTPVGSQGRVSRVPFLDAPAPFSQGPWILAALLGDCPVHLLFCRRQGDGWTLSLEPFADAVRLPRRQREEALAAYAGRYAGRLEREARQAPLQWFNFYDFWAR